MMEQAKVLKRPRDTPASLKHNWNAPHDIPADWEPSVMTFRVDEATFTQIQKVPRDETRTEEIGQKAGRRVAWEKVFEI